MLRQQRAAVLALAHPAVEAVAPDELPLLEATATAWTGRVRRDEDELLGFGAEAVVAVVSVGAVAAAQAVVQVLGSAVVDTARDEASSGMRRWLDRRSRRSGAAPDGAAPSATPPEGGEPTELALSREQLREVRRISHDRARAAGVSAEQAELIADAIVGRLSQ